MRERLEEILKLTSDDSFSHAARMVSIAKLAKAGIAEIDQAAASLDKKGAAVGAKTGDNVSPQGKATAFTPAK